MLPVFKKYSKFLKEMCGLELEEGYYWIDNQIIKAFDKEGVIHKLYRLKIDDKLNMTYSVLNGYSKLKDIEIESWNDTVIRNQSHLDTIEKDSLNIINECLMNYNKYKPEILTSGGKDSSVTMHLVKSVKNNIHSYFNNTSLDCSDTYFYINTIENLDIINPKEGFYQWRERLQFIPTRFSRACCTIFKEGAMINYLNKNDKYIFFMGMRNEESSTRSGYLDYWKNEKWSENWMGCLPIRKWSELDVWLYILYKNIPINEKYKKGYSRVGCAIACPYYTKSTWILDKYWYPKMYERWNKILDDDFLKNNKDLILNCTQKEYHTCWNGGVLRDSPTKEIIENFASRNNIEYDIAKKYFNHKCIECGKSIKKKEDISMNMKLIGRDINDFYCKKCLSKIKKLNEDDWNRMIKLFKLQGCDLF